MLYPAFILGLGLGGFIDGIVMHQILQWHHLVEDAADPIRWDGIFHVVAWTLTLAGASAVIHGWRRRSTAAPWRAQIGAMLAGWGVFNLLDSANHFILGLHHIRDDLGAPVEWDIGFLLLAIALVTGGRVLAATASRP